MKKMFALVLALVLVFAFAACGQKETGTATSTSTGTETVATGSSTETGTATETGDKSGEVMTYAQFMAADVDTQVTVETYVQAHQSWWDGKITVYSQNQDGAYFLYNMACSEEDAAKLVPGQKIKVTGYKSIWSGEVEIVDATFEFVDGDSFIAQPTDVTALLGTDELEAKMNQRIAVKGATVADSNGAAFLYKWDGSGADGDDLYFNIAVGENTYTFTVESYLCPAGSDVYEAVKGLKVGDTIDLEGFMYWYEGPQTHVTSVTVTAPAAVMSYAEYAAADVDTEVVVETYVQAHQSWWDGKITVYSQDQDGAYFLYNMACSEEDAAKLVPGQKIKVTGYKSIWSGEVEIVDASFEFVDGDSFIAQPTDVTSLLGSDELEAKMNQLIAVKGATVADSNGAAFLYKWDGSGTDGDDLYFKITVGENTYTFTVESYLCPAGSDAYEAVKGLKVGDTIDLEGFMYWYEGPQAHVTAVTVK